eukprot:c8662_g1_i1.p1 GENE.c8662_g1_i1~~c8662_g1_i1.p1  ORF type:complete len:1529 (+),score=475.03 c8662_g1_i1:351-4589(+)
MEDQLCISRCVLFCPIVDRLWFTCKLCSEHYAFARKCATTNCMGILPLLALSQTLGVEDPGVQSLMKSHECLYAKLNEVVDADLDVLVANIMRHLSSNKRIMQDQVEKSKEQTKPPLPKRSAPSSERVARREAAQVASAGARVSVSLLLTMTEHDLSLFGKMGSPGTQPNSQLRFSSILDLLNIYETHRFHLEKAAQVLYTLAPLLRNNESDRGVFQGSGWLPLLVHTHQHSPSPAMTQALKNISAACNTDVPKISDPNRTKMEILQGCAKALQAPINALHVGLCAAAVRHLSWNSRDVKAYAGRLHITALLASHLPHPSQPSSPDAGVLAAICLALATLVLEPGNKEMLRECGGIERVILLMTKNSDDFVIGASCACLTSCLQSTGNAVGVVTDAALPEFVKTLVSFLQTPARSVYATQLLQSMIKQNALVRELAIANGLFRPAAKILRYCMQARPLAYGSAVLCMKVVSCLSEVFVGLQPNQMQKWVDADGIQLLVGLLEHKGYRNDITMDLQLLVCTCLTPIVRSSPHVSAKIGEDGGVTKAISAIKIEVEAAQPPQGNGMVEGRSEQVVTSMLRLLTELCVVYDNKGHMARAGGIHVCLGLLLPSYSATFLQLVLDVLESSSIKDDKGHFVGWSKEDIATLSAFASKAAQAMSSVNPSQPNGESTPLSRNVQDKATSLANTVHYEPREAPQPSTPMFASIVTPMPVPLTPVTLVMSSPARTNTSAPAVSALSSPATVTAMSPTVSPSVSPTVSPSVRPSVVSASAMPTLVSSSPASNFTMPPKRSRSSVNDSATAEFISDGDEAARRLSKSISEMYQVARELANDSSKQQSAKQQHAVVEAKKDRESLSQLTELEQMLSALRKEVLDAEAEVAAAHNRLLACDEDVDYCQEEIAATDLSLLLMEHEDQQHDDDANPSDEPQAGDDGMDVVGFGRDDDDEDMDVDHIHDLRNTLVAELEVKEADRAAAEYDLEAADQKLQSLRIELAEKEKLFEEAAANTKSSQMTSDSGLSKSTPLSQTSQETLRRLIELKTSMMSDLVLINAHLRSTRPLSSTGSSGSLLANGDSTENHKIVATLISEHEREKRRLLQKVRDAEDRAEAFASKIVDEYRMTKQMKQLKIDEQSIKLTRVLEVVLSRDKASVYKSFYTWANMVRQQSLSKRASEIEMRERYVTRTLVQNHGETRNTKLEHVVWLRVELQTSTLKNVFRSWHMHIRQLQIQEQKRRIGAVHTSLLETSLQRWQNRRLSHAFSLWREQAHVYHHVMQHSKLVGARKVVALMLDSEMQSLQRAFRAVYMHAHASKALEHEAAIARYSFEAQRREHQLTAAQRQAEEKALRLAEEKQMSLMQTERMRQDIKKQQQSLLLNYLVRLEQRHLNNYMSRWRKWTRAQLRREFERLQESMHAFDAE